jgi:hypothetical protein
VPAALGEYIPNRVGTMHVYLELWNWDGTLERTITNCTLRFVSRKAAKRARQWLLSTRRPSGYDAGKKIKGRIPHERDRRLFGRESSIVDDKNKLPLLPVFH